MRRREVMMVMMLTVVMNSMSLSSCHKNLAQLAYIHLTAALVGTTILMTAVRRKRTVMILMMMTMMMMNSVSLLPWTLTTTTWHRRSGSTWRLLW